MWRRWGVKGVFCECKSRWERVVGLIRFNEWGTQDLKIFLQSSGGGRSGRSHHGATVHIERDGGWSGRVAPWCDRTHYERDGDGVAGSHHGATAHIKRDGDGVAGRTMARPYTLWERGGGWSGRSHHGVTVHIERDGEWRGRTKARPYTLREMGVVGSRHGATAHCDYGREEWGLSLVR